MYLSLPVPVKEERIIKVTVMDREGAMMRYGVKVRDMIFDMM